MSNDIDTETYYADHWREIDDERLANYEKILQWRPGLEALLEPAGFAPGQVVVDYGCGPGFLTVELARRVGDRSEILAQLRLQAEVVAAAQQHVLGVVVEAR